MKRILLVALCSTLVLASGSEKGRKGKSFQPVSSSSSYSGNAGGGSNGLVDAGYSSGSTGNTGYSNEINTGFKNQNGYSGSDAIKDNEFVFSGKNDGYGGGYGGNSGGSGYGHGGGGHSGGSGYGHGGGGGGDGGYGHGGGGGYHGGGQSGYDNDDYGGYPDHNDGYETDKPRQPFPGLLRAGVLLLPLLLILGLGLFFPAVVTVPVRRKRDVPLTPIKSALFNRDTVHYATRMLMRATEEDVCLKYLACRIGERSATFPLRNLIISFIKFFIPSELSRHFKTFEKAMTTNKCPMKFPAKCH